MAHLPMELLARCFSYLNAEALCAADQACRTWQRTAQTFERPLWRSLVADRLGLPTREIRAGPQGTLKQVYAHAGPIPRAFINTHWDTVRDEPRARRLTLLSSKNAILHWSKQARGFRGKRELWASVFPLSLYAARFA